MKLNENVSSLGLHLLYTNLGKPRLLVYSCEDYSYQQIRLEKHMGLEVKPGSCSRSLIFFSYCKNRQGKCSPDVLRRE